MLLYLRVSLPQALTFVVLGRGGRWSHRQKRRRRGVGFRLERGVVKGTYVYPVSKYSVRDANGACPQRLHSLTSAAVVMASSCYVPVRTFSQQHKHLNKEIHSKCWSAGRSLGVRAESSNSKIQKFVLPSLSGILPLRRRSTPRTVTYAKKLRVHRSTAYVVSVCIMDFVSSRGRLVTAHINKLTNQTQTGA